MVKIKEKSSNRILNVYTENDYSEICRCIDIIEKLKKKLLKLHKEFPENQILSTILNIIDNFLNLPTTMPLIRLTSFLEKLLS